MNCEQCTNILVGYIEGLLAEPEKQTLELHLQACPACRDELAKLRTLHDRLSTNGKRVAQADLENTVVDRIIREQSLKLREVNQVTNPFQLWRRIMKSGIAKLTVAAAIIVVAALLLISLETSVPTASAAEVLTRASEAVSSLYSVHIKSRMRTLPQDNFASIGLVYDFVPVEMWKSTDETGLVQWRIEKPERVAVMDGQEATLLVRESYACRGRCPDFMCYDCHWCGQLMDVNGLLHSELQRAQQRKDAELFMRHETVDGRELLVLEVDVLAQGDFTNDYLKNKFISKSDHTRVYYFDAESKLLKGFEIYVHADGNDVLVFETTDIEYNVAINESLFTLALPDNVIWWQDPEVLPDNERYEKMTPREAAQAFFQACTNQDWDEFLRFWPASGVDRRIKDYLGGLELVSVGEPFRSG
ncbi:MAG: anti-sigma factor family protein, partial [Planctomycetota bacterium]